MLHIFNKINAVIFLYIFIENDSRLNDVDWTSPSRDLFIITN